MAEDTKESHTLNDSVVHSNREPHGEREAANNHASTNISVVEETTKQIQAPTSPTHTPTVPPLTHSSPYSPTSSRASSPAPIFDFTSLQTSKHATSFTIRNQAKLLKLNTILSDLHLHIASAYRTSDQTLLNDVYARISNAGAGLPSFAEPVIWKKRDAVSRKLELSERRDVAGCMDDGGYYLVQHGRMEDEGSDYERLCGERNKRAREVYEAKWGWRVEGGDSDGGVEVDGEAEEQASEDMLLAGEEEEEAHKSPSAASHN